MEAVEKFFDSFFICYEAGGGENRLVIHPMGINRYMEKLGRNEHGNEGIRSISSK